MNQRYEICTDMMTHCRTEKGGNHVDQGDIQSDQKWTYCVWVREYFQDFEHGKKRRVRVLESENFETEAERDARFEQLELKYPGAEINDY